MKNKKYPISFLTGRPFNPNSGEIKEKKEKKLNSKLSNNEIYTYMNKNNQLFFNQQNWLLKRKVKSKSITIKERNDNIHKLNQLVDGKNIKKNKENKGEYKKDNSKAVLSIPKYLKTSKIRVCIEKEYESLVIDKNNLPKGIEIIDNNEKSDLLFKLNKEKSNLLQKLQLLPVSVEVSSYGMRLLKINLDRKLKEIDNAISFLSMNEPYRMIRSKTLVIKK